MNFLFKLLRKQRNFYINKKYLDKFLQNLLIKTRIFEYFKNFGKIKIFENNALIIILKI